MIECGRLVMVRQALTNASRAGCREAGLATTRNVQDVENVVQDYLRSVIPNASDSNKVAISVTPASLDGISSGTSITVQVTVSVADVSWLPGNFVSPKDGLAIRGRSTQRRE
jgi:hypothetical protein